MSYVMSILTVTLLTIVFSSTSLLGNDNKERGVAALDVVIPSYDSEGRIQWELRALSVEPIGDDRFLAREPVLEMLNEQNDSSFAQSDRGVFDLAQGRARGENTMKVTGDGFEAVGGDWSFDERKPNQSQRVRFDQETAIGFDDDFDELLAGLPPKNVDPVTPKKKNKKPSSPIADVGPFPTHAYALNFELISLDAGGHQFILNGDVSVNTSDASIICDVAEIFLGSGQDGQTEVSKIDASGSVKLTQLGRECWADHLQWDTNKSQVLLMGNARVLDAEWGEAVGEKILLEKGRGRAQVIGGKQGRSKLSLPKLNGFSFPVQKEPVGQPE
jgi:lipopolysaccharide export system protein LptA